MLYIDEKIKLLVWQKGIKVPGEDPAICRVDRFGSVIYYNDYETSKVCGWDIEYIVPEAKGGSDDISNLQPLHWENLYKASSPI